MKVRQDGGKAAFRQQREGFVPVPGCIDAVSKGGEEIDEEVADGRFILDHQDAMHHNLAFFRWDDGRVEPPLS
jgi:hypothetical protein